MHACGKLSSLGKPKRIVEKQRIILRIFVSVGFDRRAKWIFAQEPAAALVIVARSIVVHSRFLIEFASRVLEWVDKRPAVRGHLSE